ncbi:uncharacterized protein LOC125497765 [Beta vulgaris subsp. vulgaris]|uniref:uncharacterized protein LOC125497765 n=1 Tax=Beta vulgaris subsp. vulgaris TaxID=3555 RepID=UPI0020375B04|nr:uncharacterized protein LOC125497765 [Beta vulgaris subsp. vulgaris]
MWDIDECKASGPDGFGSALYKYAWDDIGSDVSNVILDFLNIGNLLKEINATSLTLIPKGYERKISSPGCIIKLGLKKAYDTVEWDFVEEMLEALQFHEHFIKLMKLSSAIMGTFDARFPIVLDMIGFVKGSFPKVQSCKVEPNVSLMMEGFQLFFNTTGLKVGPEKTFVFCSGMSNEEVNKILDMTGFVKGSFPFRYLGIPICCKKKSIAECENILEKMRVRIKVWSSRNFLSKGVSDSSSPGKVARKDVSKPKKEGCLRLLNLCNWNSAALGKHVWMIDTRKENLWVKWVHTVYLRGQNWWEYIAKKSDSWYWRRIRQVKEQMEMWVSENQLCSISKYSIQRIYKMMEPVRFALGLGVLSLAELIVSGFLMQ